MLFDINLGLIFNYFSVRRTSLRAIQSPANQVKKSAASSFAVPSTPFRVKPSVFAKALAKTTHLTYVRQSNGAQCDQLMSKKTERSGTVSLPSTHGAYWLFGILGDDWNHVTDKNDFPAWSSREHSNKCL